MGFRPSKEELKDILEEIDEDGSGKLDRSILKKMLHAMCFSWTYYKIKSFVLEWFYILRYKFKCWKV